MNHAQDKEHSPAAGFWGALAEEVYLRLAESKSCGGGHAEERHAHAARLR